MAGKSLFDNIVFAWRGAVALSNAVQSILIDLDLPIGYAAEFLDARFRLTDFGNLDIDPTRNTDVRGAFVLDPDDETSVEIPTETISHDVAADCNLNNYYIENAGATEGVVGESPRSEEYVNFNATKGDVVSARDARFNVISSHAAAALGLDCDLTVRYTLKKLGKATIDQLIQLLT